MRMKTMDGRGAVWRTAVVVGAAVAGILTFAAPACAADAAPVKPFATMQIDAAPGYIQQFTAALADADDRGSLGVGITVRFTTLQPSAEWTSMFSLCATSVDPPRSECVRIAVDRDNHELFVESASKSGEAKYVSSPLETSSKLALADTLRVTMRVDKKRALTFSVNGEDVHSLALDFEATHYTYACSSLICDLTLADLLAPKAATSLLTLSVADINALLGGNDALEQGHFDLAIERLSKFIAFAPMFAMPYAQRARACIGQGQPDRALADLDDALHLESITTVDGKNGKNGRSGDGLIALLVPGSTRPDVEALRDQLRAEMAPDTSRTPGPAPQAH
jgi:tetratricopeptide (TPR) repeat protein